MKTTQFYTDRATKNAAIALRIDRSTYRKGLTMPQKIRAWDLVRKINLFTQNDLKNA